MNEDLLLQQDEDNVEEVVLPPQRRRLGCLPLRVRLLAALCLSVAVVICKLCAPGVSDGLSRWIVGDGSERLQQAFYSMQQALGEGERLSEVWTAFCQELSGEAA